MNSLDLRVEQMSLDWRDIAWLFAIGAILYWLIDIVWDRMRRK